MKVVHIITGLATGGAERALYNLLQGGLRLEFNSYVISLSNAGTIGPQIEALSVPVITLGMKAGRPSLRGLLKLRTIMQALKPDLIQGWMYHGNLAATLARSMVKRKPVLIWNIRQSLYQLENEKILTRQVIRANRFFSRTPDSLLYNSQLSRQQHTALGFTDNKGQVIPNGIDLQKFCFSEEARQRIRIELSIPTDALVIGHIARLHPMKDHSLLLGAAVILAGRHSSLHIILSGLDVSLNNEQLAKLVPDQLRSRFHLLGERSDVHELMSAMDIAVSSSYSEAFPNVVGEAMAAGVPCVVTDVGDSALIVDDVGVVVPPRDKAALIAGLDKLLTMPESERRRLGQQARKRIEENYTLQAIVKKYVTLYKEKFLEKRNH